MPGSWATAIPSSATAPAAGRCAPAAEFGNIFDHFSVVYEFDNGVKFFSQCRQQAGCANDMSGHVLGSRGTAL